MEYRTLGDTIYLWFAVNSTAGEAADATGSPTFDVRKGGASSSGIPTLEGTATLLSHANYPAGCYEIAIAATGGNGFEADAEYGVFCQAAVSSVNPAGFVGKFKLSPVPANSIQIGGQNVGLSSDNRLRVDVAEWNDIPLATTNPLPNAAADAAGGLPISDAGGLDLDARLDAAVSSRSSHSAADVWAVGTRTLTAATNITAAIAAAVWEVATSTLTNAGTIGKLLVDNINATISSRSSHSAADVATQLGNGSAFTEAGGTGDHLTALATATELAKVPKSDGSVTWNATALASMVTQATTALTNLFLHYLFHTTYDPASKPGAADALLNELVESDSGVARFTANALEQAPSGGGGGDATEAKQDQIIALIGTPDVDLAADIAALSAAAGGSGARTVTITVNDGSTALQNANVRMIQGAENYVVATNASGVAVFALDDATWSVAITKPGYTFTPTTLIVNGTETQTYSMTALMITPSNPGQVTGYLTIFGIAGEAEEGAEIHLQQLQPISGTGVGYDGAVRTEESGADGVVEFTNMFKGGRYVLWRGTDAANKKQFTLASNATDPTALSSFVGSP